MIDAQTGTQLEVNKLLTFFSSMNEIQHRILSGTFGSLFTVDVLWVIWMIEIFYDKPKNF